MQNSSIDTFKKLQVIILVTCYFFIALSHMFFLPKLTDVVGKKALSHNSIFKRKPETSVSPAGSINFFQRTDKFIVNDKKSPIDLMKVVISSFILLLFARLIWKLNPKHHLTFCWLTVNYQHSYLSFCTFKI